MRKMRLVTDEGSWLSGVQGGGVVWGKGEGRGENGSKTARGAQLTEYKQLGRMYCTLHTLTVESRP